MRRGGLGRGRGLGRPKPTTPDENNNTVEEAQQQDVEQPKNIVRRGLGRGRGLGRPSPLVKPTTQPEPTPTEPTVKPSIAAPRGGLARGRGRGLGRGGLSRPLTATVVSESDRSKVNNDEDTVKSTLSSTLEALTVIDDIQPEDSASMVGVSTSEIPTASEIKREDTSSVQSKLTTSCNSKSLIEERQEKVNKFGKAGVTCQLATNFVKLTTVEKDPRVFQYSVKFSPSADSRRLCTKLLFQHEDKFTKDFGRVFDGRAILYSSKSLTDGEKQELILDSKSNEGTAYKVRIKLARLITVDSPKMVPVYNTILAKIQKEMNLIPIRDSYYAMHREKRINQYGISVWPGYTATVQEQVGGLMLQVDLSFKVLRNQNVLEIFAEQKKKGGDFKSNCLRALVGQTILTRYNNKNYRIDDIDWDVNPQSTFTKGFGENARQITFMEYFQEQYNLKIKDKRQPLLINRPKKKEQRNKRTEDGKREVIYLIPELCNATGLTDAMRCDFRVMQELAKTTRVKPEVRNSELQAFVDDIHKMDYARDEFSKWGLVLEKTPFIVMGRNIHKENLLLGGGAKKPVNAQADFGGVVVKSAMLDPISLNNWVLFYEQKDQKKVDAFIECYRKCARQLAQTVAKPNLVKVTGKAAEQTRTMSEYLSANKNTQLVMNFMASKREDKYNATKVLCCVENPVPSQVIISRTLPDDPKQGKFASVTQKIALQINAKLGGSLWAVQIPLNRTMLVGIDVWHGATKTSKRASVVGLVASYDEKYTKWFSKGIFQDSSDHEISNKLKANFVAALKHFRHHNNYLPETIVIYRDGVSDGALEEFRNNEIVEFQRALREFGDTYTPKLAVIVVSKRINTRMYAIKGKTLDNPMPGTVMDQKVTKPYYQDWYLVSQYVRQGTVTPSHFIVMEDGELSSDHLQKLSYKLTHMYYNWPGTVRVPAPCQYAHKLAALIGENIQQQPDEDLSDKLYYL